MWDVFANQSEKFDSFASHSLLSLLHTKSNLNLIWILENSVKRRTVGCNGVLIRLSDYIPTTYIYLFSYNQGKRIIFIVCMYLFHEFHNSIEFWNCIDLNTGTYRVVHKARNWNWVQNGPFAKPPMVASFNCFFLLPPVSSA